MSGGESLEAAFDAIGLAAARARGKRPQFFRDADVERLLGITLALAMEHAVTRQRLDALERLLAARGLLPDAAVDGYVPDGAAEAERGRWLDEYLARVLRPVLQAAEAAASGTADPKPEDVQEELRHA